MTKHFRPCAGAVVFNREGLVFLGNRIDTKEDAWQFPQGGIEQGESPACAARRELLEETNITSVQLIYVDEEPFRYEFTDDIKEKFRQRQIFNDGQDIYFALFFFDGKSEEINVKTDHPEFRDYQWKTFDFAIENIINFKKDVYKAVAKRFLPKIEQYLHHPLDISNKLA